MWFSPESSLFLWDNWGRHILRWQAVIPPVPSTMFMYYDFNSVVVAEHVEVGVFRKMKSMMFIVVLVFMKTGFTEVTLRWSRLKTISFFIFSALAASLTSSSSPLWVPHLLRVTPIAESVVLAIEATRDGSSLLPKQITQGTAIEWSVVEENWDAKNNTQRRRERKIDGIRPSSLFFGLSWFFFLIFLLLSFSPSTRRFMQQKKAGDQ